MRKAIALSVLLLAGCAGAKLEKQQKEIEQLQSQAGSLVAQLKQRADELETLNAGKAELESRVIELEGKVAAAEARVESLRKSNVDLSAALSAGKDALASKLNAAIADKDEAARRLSETVKEKLALERLKDIYRSARDKTAADLARLQAEREKLASRLGLLDAETRRREEAAKAEEAERSASRLRTREEMGGAADAVLKDIQAGLAGVKQDGEGFSVTLSDALLFEEGEAKLSESGAARLGRLAAALKSLPGKRLRVEAHSDNAPFKKSLIGGYDGHWELSAARATAVARWLHMHGALDPALIEATGHGEFRPIADNGTPQGRAANRRIVLVVSPK